ncbi:Imm52 family immunity protein [Pyxidicoccus sp. 3LG]
MIGSSGKSALLTAWPCAPVCPSNVVRVRGETRVTANAETQTRPDSYYAGAYWGPRKESPEECARRAVTFLDLLAACDPLLAHWNKIPKPRGKGRKTPLMPPDLSTLTEAYRRGVNREPGGPPIEDLGLTVSAYNDGVGPDFVSVRMHCGSYAEFSTANACVMRLPSKGENAERIFSALVLTEVVRSMALAWEPDWAVAMSRTHREMDDRQGEAAPGKRRGTGRDADPKGNQGDSR